MSDTMTEGNIVEWLKKVGDDVEPGDVLAEVETDKATMELESYFEGKLLYIGVESGVVEIDQVLAVIGEEGEDWKAALEASQTEDPKESAGAVEEKQEGAASASVETVQENQSVQVQAATDDRVKSSPLARKMAAEKGVDLSNLKGSGIDGRIIKRDVENISSNGQKRPAPARIEISGEDIEIPVTQMRKTIARRLGESKFSAPHFYLTVAIEMDKAMSSRQDINSMIAPDKVSYNDLVIKAAAVALRSHPMVNSSWQEDTIVQHGNVNIGVAVAVEDGLLVPVVRNADQKNLRTINAEVRDYAGRAREKKLQLDEMQGNTFTISNLGMFGIEEFTAIINPPDACILAVGGINQVPMVKNGEIVVGHQMKVTLSCDHRVVDGATGAKFLQTFKTLLENPVRIIA